MSASEKEPQLPLSVIDRQIRLETYRFERAVEALAEQGPGAINLIADMMAMSARFNQLEALKRGYLS